MLFVKINGIKTTASRSSAGETVTICRAQTLCSGAPALPDLEISAGALFT